MKKLIKLLIIMLFSIFICINVEAANSKVVIVGDSISSYENTSSYGAQQNQNFYYYPQGDVSLQNMWWSKLLNSKGWTLLTNESIAGTKVSWNGSNNTDFDNSKVYMASDTRIKGIGAKGTPDKIFIFAGVNDVYDSSMPMGDASKLSTANVSTVANAYATMLKKTTEKYPNAEIICIIPFMPKYLPDGMESRFKSLASIINSAASKYNAQVINLQKLNLANEDFADVGIHPNTSGMQKISNYISSNYKENSNSNNNNNDNPTKGSKKESIKTVKKDTTDANCDTLFGTNTETGKILHDIYNIIKVIVPIILLAMSIKDFGAGMLSQNDKALRDALIRFSKRLVIAILILVLPTILNFVLKLLEIDTCFL